MCWHELPQEIIFLSFWLQVKPRAGLINLLLPLQSAAPHLSTFFSCQLFRLVCFTCKLSKIAPNQLFWKVTEEKCLFDLGAVCSMIYGFWAVLRWETDVLEMHASLVRTEDFMPLTLSKHSLDEAHVWNIPGLPHLCFQAEGGCQVSDLFLRGFGSRVLSAWANRA